MFFVSTLLSQQCVVGVRCTTADSERLCCIGWNVQLGRSRYGRLFWIVWSIEKFYVRPRSLIRLRSWHRSDTELYTEDDTKSPGKR